MTCIASQTSPPLVEDSEQNSRPHGCADRLDGARSAVRRIGENMNSERRLISITEVQAAVAQMFHLSRAELLSRSRRQHIAHARQIAMYLSRELAGGGRRSDSTTREPTASFPRIGIAFRRDHSSVIHACNRIARRRRIDAELADMLERLVLDVRDPGHASGHRKETL